MRNLFFSILIFATLSANAQPFIISFSGTDLSTVKVQNLTTGVIVDVPAGDVLHLSTTTGINEVNNKKSFGLKVYPNPMTVRSTLEILPPIAGDVIISVYDLTGKVLAQFKGYLENYSQDFNLSGIKNGLHIINIQGKGYQFSEKLLSTGKSNGTAIIARLNNNIQAISENKIIQDPKGIQATVDMAYNTGERLKYTAVSGNNSTVKTDIPTADKTVIFTFTECQDGDNNYYPVVQINTQLWMAENLKTLKLNDGTPLTVQPDNVLWGLYTSPCCCWYGNIFANKNIYGTLYNWYTVNTGKLCPIGWHVPTYDEWTTLSTYLAGESVAGGKLKETGTTHWNSPNTGASNETGFTALPGGYRLNSGTFDYIRNTGLWWSSTNGGDTSIAFDWDIGYDFNGFGWFLDNSKCGLSIRCLKD
jgi:uncharacterized protein (TIGR02145 family)